MPREALVFDVNETLLDLAGLDPEFERLFGAAAVKGEWFAQLLAASFTSALTDRYVDFGVLAGQALKLVAKRRGRELTREEVERVVSGMTRLAPHPDVAPALERLRGAGFRLAALSNSPYAMLRAQLRHAALDGFFEAILSVDDVRRFKPHPDVYRSAAAKLGVAPSGMRMIAAHNWDVTGAARAGCRTAFVARPGRFLGEMDERVPIIGADLGEVARLIEAAQESEPAIGI